MAPAVSRTLLLVVALALASPFTPPRLPAVPHVKTYGPTGCAGVPRALPDRSAGQAIATVPNLSRLSAGLATTGLAAELDHTPNVTVFAPSNRAFEKTAGSVAVDPAVLRYHIVPGRFTPDHLLGAHRTLQGGELSVARDGLRFRVNATAGLICTRVRAANGDVYLIDAVLTPR